jgi:hypothetical protein
MKRRVNEQMHNDKLIVICLHNSSEFQLFYFQAAALLSTQQVTLHNASCLSIIVYVHYLPYVMTFLFLFLRTLFDDELFNANRAHHRWLLAWMK